MSKATEKVAEKVTETVAKKSRKKKTVSTSAYIEYQGICFDVQEIASTVEKLYPDSEIRLYIKPEEKVAYYTVNGEGGDDYKVDI